MRRYGEVRHEPIKVQRASQRQGLRGTRKFKIDVQVYRYEGGFEAMACFPKGAMNVGPRESYRYKRMAPRCGRARSGTPTKAVRGALARLTRATR